MPGKLSAQKLIKNMDEEHNCGLYRKTCLPVIEEHDLPPSVVHDNGVGAPPVVDFRHLRLGPSSD